MPDDKSKVGEPDRRRVSADEDYELRNIAERHNLTLDQVRELIARVGNNREAVNQAAKELKEDDIPAVIKETRAARENPTVVPGTRARQGVISHRVVRVLIISTVGAFVVLALLYLYYFGWPFNGS